MQEVGGAKFNKCDASILELLAQVKSRGKQRFSIQSVASCRNLTHRRSQSGRIHWRRVSQQHTKYEDIAGYRESMQI